MASLVAFCGLIDPTDRILLSDEIVLCSNGDSAAVGILEFFFFSGLTPVQSEKKQYR